MSDTLYAHSISGIQSIPNIQMYGFHYTENNTVFWAVTHVVGESPLFRRKILPPSLMFKVNQARNQQEQMTTGKAAQLIF